MKKLFRRILPWSRYYNEYRQVLEENNFIEIKEAFKLNPLYQDIQHIYYTNGKISIVVSDFWHDMEMSLYIYDTVSQKKICEMVDLINLKRCEPSIDYLSYYSQSREDLKRKQVEVLEWLLNDYERILNLK